MKKTLLLALIIAFAATIVCTGGLIVDWFDIRHYCLKEDVMWIKVTEIVMGLFSIFILIKEFVWAERKQSKYVEENV